MSWVEECIPLTAIISGEVAVTQITTYNAPNGETLSMATKTTYLIGELFIKEKIGVCLGGNHSEPEYGDMYFVNMGTWRIIKHERIGL
jgi:hypothetical protein